MLPSNAYYNHLRRSLVIADSAQTCIDCKFAPQSLCGIVGAIQWYSNRHRHKHRNKYTKQTVVRHALIA